jgi:hypothetical protein
MWGINMKTIIGIGLILGLSACTDVPKERWLFTECTKTGNCLVVDNITEQNCMEMVFNNIASIENVVMCTNLNNPKENHRG